MEIIPYINKEGQCIKLDKEEAKELKFLINRALQFGTKESGFINTTVEIETYPLTPKSRKEGG